MDLKNHSIDKINDKIQMETGQRKRIVWRNELARPRPFFKLFLSFIFYLGNLYLIFLCQVLANERNRLDGRTLPDIGFDFTFYWKYSLFIVDLFIILILALFLILCLFNDNGFRIIQRFFLISGIVYFFHALCISINQLPISSKNINCLDKIVSNATRLEFIANVLERSWTHLSTLNLFLQDKPNLCGGHISSLHSINIILGWFIIDVIDRNLIYFLS